MTTTPQSGAAKPALSPEYESCFQRYEERKRRRAELRPTNKAAVFDALAVAGIVSVVISFDGYGDSGQIEGIEARDAGGEAALPQVDVKIAVARYDEDDPELDYEVRRRQLKSHCRCEGCALLEDRAGQRDCRVRDDSRNACEGADTAMLHGYVLQRREPARTTDLERRATGVIHDH